MACSLLLSSAQGDLMNRSHFCFWIKEVLVGIPFFLMLGVQDQVWATENMAPNPYAAETYEPQIEMLETRVGA